MDCKLKKIKNLPDGLFKHHCDRCGFTISSHYDNPRLIHNVCTVETTPGVGTELKIIIGWINRINSKSSCGACNDRAAKMDLNGILWCEKNKRLILEWLKEGAKDRKIPFSNFLANGAINLAIRRAKKKLTEWEAL